MTPAERDRAYRAAQNAILKRRSELLKATAAEVVELLKKASREIKLTLASAPTEYQAWYLPQLQAEIDRVMAQFGGQSATVLAGAADEAWALGQSFVSAPLAAGGVAIAATLPTLDPRQLLAMRTFMVDRIKNVSTEAASAIKSELGMVVIGVRPVSEAITSVQAHLGGASRTRATTIVRTEVSRVFGVASNERIQQAAAAGVEMDKVWRRSGKLHPRVTHALADGQRVPYDQPFLVGGTAIMFPHDPAAPAKETINCGCVMIPRPRGWATTKPDHKPFTEDELRRNPKLRAIVEGKDGPTLRELEAQRAAKRVTGPDTLRAPKVRERLKAARAEIGADAVEHAIVWDKDGNELLRKRGGRDSIRFTPAELGLMKNAIGLHNHPDIASFSPDDVAFAMAHEMAEMHVVDRFFRYAVRAPKTGWSAKLWRDTVGPLYDAMEREVKNELSAARDAGLITQAQADANVADETWRRVNRKVDLGYRRRKRSDGER